MAQQIATIPAAQGRMGDMLRTARTPRRAGHAWVQPAVLVVALVFFLAPWIAAAVFGFTRPGEGLTFTPASEALTNPRGIQAIKETLLITAATTVMMLALLVPTVVFVNLKAPKLATVVEMVSVMPLVVPAVALVSGASEFYRIITPGFINSRWSLVPLYVILVMPLCYRAIDAGVKTLHLDTLFAAAASLGDKQWSTLVRIVLPNLRVAILSASLLCIAMCLSEFAMASLLLHYTFPVYMVEISSTNPRGIAALSFITTVITWLLLASISRLSRSQKQQ
ncbi:ABC transporter permease [Corynebacterium pelargi]|uniref:Uncharacterized protein n=1 Tax=Corynebacterium pelargi TaxID=1471400 RepID=A0A410W896_9CORY|nr:ABC transporter permease subunit [Corynebacterium pelargi]QAU52161.1 hypothetical protein CPELA_04410 [Corynebacterium pelargi]GGG69709.1 spermidine/putrescine ABC transporter permease [Corynebacterium pelargi]